MLNLYSFFMKVFFIIKKIPFILLLFKWIKIKISYVFIILLTYMILHLIFSFFLENEILPFTEFCHKFFTDWNKTWFIPISVLAAFILPFEYYKVFMSVLMLFTVFNTLFIKYKMDKPFKSAFMCTMGVLMFLMISSTIIYIIVFILFKIF